MPHDQHHLFAMRAWACLPTVMSNGGVARLTAA